MKVKVVKIDDGIQFSDGSILWSHHDTDCCESHYLDFDHIKLDDFDGLEFDLSDDNFFERIEDYGIALIPVNGHPVRIPGYGSNNGYYNSELHLILENTNNKSTREFDISDCQEYEPY